MGLGFKKRALEIKKPGGALSWEIVPHELTPHP